LLQFFGYLVSLDDAGRMAALPEQSCWRGTAEDARRLDANRSAVAKEPGIFRDPNNISNFFRFLVCVTPKTTLNKQYDTAWESRVKKNLASYANKNSTEHVLILKMQGNTLQLDLAIRFQLHRKVKYLKKNIQERLVQNCLPGRTPA